MRKRKITILLILILTLLIPNTKVAAFEQGLAGISKYLDNYIPIYNWTTDVVNLRKEPNIKADIICKIPKREKIIIFNNTSYNEWVQVQHNSNIGYVHMDYLRDSELPKLEFTKKEMEVFQRIVEAETQGQSIEAKENVASVIINRLLHIDFPDNLITVIYQENQFSPVTKIFEITVSEDTKKAIDNILNNGVTTDALYFCNKKLMTKSQIIEFEKGKEYLFTDDANHSFYR